MTEQELEKRLNRLEEMVDLILESKSEHIIRGLGFNKRMKLVKLWESLTDDLVEKHFPIN